MITFSHVFSNSFIDGWSKRARRQSLTVAFMGNATTFEKAIVNCVSSPAHAADLVFCVKREDVNMTEYLPYEHEKCLSSRDWSGSDVCHTEKILDGLLEFVIQANSGRLPVLLVAASGGCVPALELGRRLCSNGHVVRGLIVDSGVPGSGPATAFPISVWAYRSPEEYWNGGSIVDIWQSHGYTVDFVYEYRYGGHASGFKKWTLDECKTWFEMNAEQEVESGNAPIVGSMVN